MTPAASAAIRSRWTLDEYQDLVHYLMRVGLRISSVAEYGSLEPGIWLRHDVELSLGAALKMAELEARVGVDSSYFVCVESPFLPSHSEQLESSINRLVALDRDVSFHLLLSSEVEPIERRLELLEQAFPLVQPSSLTFHAPGLASEVLATTHLGEHVYGPLAGGIGRYFSDSTGRWRWGDPRYADLIAADVVQLLVHPFWWSGTYIPAEIPVGAASVFLPQFASLDAFAPGAMNDRVLP